MYITIDIGGTNIRFASFKSLDSSSLIQTIKFKSSELQDYDTFLDESKKVILQMLNENSLEGIAIGVPCRVNNVTGVIGMPDAYPQWWNKNLREDFTKMFATNIKIANDVVISGLADKVFGKLDSRNIAFIIMGTGINAVKLQDYKKEILITPMEFGHIIVEPNGEKCICGQVGCLEVYTSGKGLKSLYGKYASEINDLKIWESVANYLAQGIISLQNINQVDKVVFGGGLITKRESILKDLRRILQVRSTDMLIPDVELTAFPENSGNIGALALLGQMKIVNLNEIG